MSIIQDIQKFVTSLTGKRNSPTEAEKVVTNDLPVQSEKKELEELARKYHDLPQAKKDDRMKIVAERERLAKVEFENVFKNDKFFILPPLAKISYSDMPDKVAGIELNHHDKVFLVRDKWTDNIGYTTGTNLGLVEDPKTKKVALQLTELIMGKNEDDINSVNRWIAKNEVVMPPNAVTNKITHKIEETPSYIEKSGLKKELEDKGLTTASLNNDPTLKNVSPNDAKDLKLQAALSYARGFHYAVIEPYAKNQTENLKFSKDNVSFHSNIKDANTIALSANGSIIRTNDLKDALTNHKVNGVNGDVHIIASTKLEEKNNKSIKQSL